MIGDKTNLATELDSLSRCGHKVRGNQPSLSMSLLWPWVGEIDMKSPHRAGDDSLGKKGPGFSAHDAHVSEIMASDPVAQVLDVRPGPLDRQKIGFRSVSGSGDQKAAFPRTDLDLDLTLTTIDRLPINPAAQGVKREQGIPAGSLWIRLVPIPI